MSAILRLIHRAIGAEVRRGPFEVRGAWGTNVADFEDEQTDALARAVAQVGFGVSAVASPIGKVDVALPVEHEVVARMRARADVAEAEDIGSASSPTPTAGRRCPPTSQAVGRAARALAGLLDRIGVTAG